MALKKVILQNKGMSQDVAISKEQAKDGVQEFAYENRNIRITAASDGTLLSVTNIQGPKKLKCILVDGNTQTEINSFTGHIVGKCEAGDFYLLFTHRNRIPQKALPARDWIYRINLNEITDDSVTVNVLWEGDLNLSSNNPLDTLYYYEGQNVQKVYWTDGLNMPRFINIITPNERTIGIGSGNCETYQENIFEFYPETDTIPKFLIEKNYTSPSEHPAGVVQYFVTYYNENGAETLIVNSSDLWTLNFSDRGAKADEVGTCALNLTITNLSKNFDYLRVYSATRTSLDGEVIVRMVGDYSIKDVDSVSLIDTAINQETLDASYIYYIGGTPFIAKTLDYKDGTIFFGNLRIPVLDISSEEFQKLVYDSETDSYLSLEDCIKEGIKVINKGTDNEFHEALWVDFTHYDPNDTVNFPKEITNSNAFGEYYPYSFQTQVGSLKYKTFKGGEMYRFGIQFQNNLGQWTQVIWIGDKECTNYPIVDEKKGKIYLNNANFNGTALFEGIREKLRALGIKNYRIVMADPEGQNGRRVVAQGLMCPTLFTPGQRAMGTPYTLPSWIMRPRGGAQSCYHFEPLQAAEETKGAELWSYQLFDNKPNVDGIEFEELDDYYYTHPYVFSKRVQQKQAYVVTFLSIDSNEICIKSTKVYSDSPETNFSDVNFTEGSGEYQEIVDEYKWTSYTGMKGKTLTKFYNDISTEFLDAGLSPSQYLPSLEAIRNLAKSIHETKKKSALIKIFGFLAVAIICAVAICLAIFTAGAGTGISAAMVYGACILAMAIATASAATAITSEIQLKNTDFTYGMSSESLQESSETLSKLEPWQLSFLSTGYYVYYVGNTSNKALSSFFGGKGNPLTVKPLANDIDIEKDVGKDVNGLTVLKDPTDSNQDISGIIYKQYSSKLKPKYLESKFDNSDDKFAVHMVSIKPLNGLSIYQSLINKQQYQYFVDESTITFHTPSFEDIRSESNLLCRVIGTAPVSKTYCNAEIKLSNKHLESDGLDNGSLTEVRNQNGLLTSDYIFVGPKWFRHEEANDKKVKYFDHNTNLLINSPAKHKVFMWGRADSIIGADGNTAGLKEGETSGDGDVLTELPDVVVDKTMYNHQFCLGTQYFDPSNQITYDSPSSIGVFREDSVDGITYLNGKDRVIYQGNYETLVIENKKKYVGDKNIYGLYNFSSLIENDTVAAQDPGKKLTDPSFDTVVLKKNDAATIDYTYGKYMSTPRTRGTVHIQFKSSNHCVFSLSNTNNNRKLLPRFQLEPEYDGEFTRKLKYGDTVPTYSEIPLEYVMTNCWANNIEYEPSVFIPYHHGKTLEFDFTAALNGLEIAWIGKDGIEYPYSNYNDYGNFDNISISFTEHYQAANEKITLECLNTKVFYITLKEQCNTVYKAFRAKAQAILMQNNDTITAIPKNEIYFNREEIVKIENGVINVVYKDVTDDAVLKFVKFLRNCSGFPKRDSADATWEKYYKFLIGNYNNEQKSFLLQKVDEALDKKFPVYMAILHEDSDYFDIVQIKRFRQIKKDKTVVVTTNYTVLTEDEYNALYNKPLFLNGNSSQLIRITNFSTLLSGETILNQNTVTAFKGYVHYNGFPIQYNAPIINIEEVQPQNPFFFIGELYRNIKPKDLYGGYDEKQMRKLKWYPISETMPIASDEDDNKEDKDVVKIMEGDTYFQRWDCLKTYPATSEDFENKVVDITSFMVESHKNLDERTDKNRATFNMKVTPENFNLFNPVYSQKNNLFAYYTKWNNLSSDLYPQQFTWSMTKNYLGDVDTWTGVTVANVSNCYYPITKVVNYGNTLYALTEHSIEIINFNNKNFIPSSDNTFIELANSSKVDGTVKRIQPYGTHNVSIKMTERGLYFIDDNEYSLIRITQESVDKIQFGKIDSWFKHNVVKGTYQRDGFKPFHLEYDNINKDLYLINEDIALIYNEILDQFTSYIDFQDCDSLFNYNGKLLSVGGYTGKGVYEMYKGKFNTNYREEENPMDYYIHFRVNPNELTDKIFTNVEFRADVDVNTKLDEYYKNNLWFTSELNSDNKKSDEIKPFNFIRVWDEYQDTGEVELNYKKDYSSNLQQKFRLWKSDIPRDVKSKYKRDRIRNPWIHLVLGKKFTRGEENYYDDNTMNNKMELHNLIVQYME